MIRGYRAVVVIRIREFLRCVLRSYLLSLVASFRRFVSSLIVSLVPVPRSSSVVRVNVRVIVRIPSPFVTVVASFIVRLAFLEIA